MPYQSLYRRYRPQRFGEVVGQDHVSQTLRNAVRDGRVAHAYLFSGPRGTGKTSTARILAKALNCPNLADGEPCGTCESCVAVADGSSLDVHELDAASNNGVDAMRDLVARAALGTPGRTKVYIVDEVHMLSAAAANALLKTLEEPPAHVVFVLATTDPQKVLPTIRSRTQHFEFRLLPPDVLAAHLRRVAEDAGLSVAPEAIDLVARRGAGSVRDALSALDQVAAAGGTHDEGPSVDEIVEGLCERDAGRALVAVAQRVEAGQDARQLTRDLLEHLRQAFLSTMARDLVGLPDDDLERVEGQARRLGPAAIVRAMEVLGDALVDMREAPDPRVLLDVAVVRLARPDADTSVAALLERVERLERAAASRPASSAPAPVRPAPPTTPARQSAARQSAARQSATPQSAPRPAPTRPTAPAHAPAARPPAPEAAEVGDGDGDDAKPMPTREELTLAWGDHVLTGLQPAARALYKAGRFIATEGSVAVFGVPNRPHVERCEKRRDDVEAALSSYFDRPIRLRLTVVDDDAPPTRSAPNADTPDTADAAATADEAIDLDDLRDAADAGLTSPVDHVVQAFEGAEVVEE